MTEGTDHLLVQHRRDIHVYPSNANNPVTASFWVIGGELRHMLTLSPRLNLDEQTRAARFKREVDRDTFVATHTAIRTVFGEALKTAPQTVVFNRAACSRCGALHGRPYVASSTLSFSISRSGHFGLVAVSDHTIGVDIEQIASEQTVGDILPLLHPNEQEQVNALTGIPRLSRFTQIWARKEAYLKGHGIGLNRDISLDDLGHHASRGNVNNWTIVDLALGGDTSAAIAIESADGNAHNQQPSGVFSVDHLRYD